MIRGRKVSTLFVTALLAAGVVSCGSDTADERADAGAVADTASGTSNAGASDDAISGYLAFASRLQDARDAPLQAAEIADGLRQLAGVAGTLDGARPELSTDLRALAEHVLLNPDSLDVAATVTEALTDLAMVVQTARGAGAAPVQEAAASLRADMPLPAQSAALRGFFQGVAAALEAA